MELKNSFTLSHTCEHDEKDDMEKRGKILIIRLAAAIALTVFGMMPLFQSKIALLFYITAVLLIGYDVFTDAISEIFRGKILNKEMLIIVASITALLIGESVECIMVISLFQLGTFMQNRTISYSRNVAKNQIDIFPDTVKLLMDDQITDVHVEKVKIGELFVLAPGDIIPLDGQVLNGESEIDTSFITGKSSPKIFRPGDIVLSGYMNLSGDLTVMATELFKNSTVSKITNLIDNAEQQYKNKSNKFTKKFATIYTSSIIVLAVIIAFAVPIIGKFSIFEWIKRALTLIIIAYPVGIEVSLPLTYYLSICAASKKGLIFKNADVIERLSHVTAVVFDKTSIFTKGTFEVISVNSEPGFKIDEVLKIAAYAEYFSVHPIAKAIVKHANIKVRAEHISNIHEEPDKGISVLLENRHIITVGNRNYLDSLGIKYKENEEINANVYVAVDRTCIGMITLRESINADSSYAVKRLKDIDIDRIIMITEDNKNAAAQIAEELDIKEFYADCRMEDKVARINIVKEMEENEGKVAVIGDGADNGSVFNAADIGFSIGGFTPDSDLEDTDIIIMCDKPSKVAEAVEHSRFSQKIIKENILFVSTIKIIVMILGVTGLVQMWLAVIVDMGSSLLCLTNSLRILENKEKD